jgi:hypothetical protein
MRLGLPAGSATLLSCLFIFEASSVEEAIAKVKEAIASQA